MWWINGIEWELDIKKQKMGSDGNRWKKVLEQVDTFFAVVVAAARVVTF